MSMLDELLDDIVHVEDDAIAEAITLLLERSKLVVEGAGAASVAALLHGAADGQNACALLSGGNIDATLLDLGRPPRADTCRALPRASHPCARPARAGS